MAAVLLSGLLEDKTRDGSFPVRGVAWGRGWGGACWVLGSKCPLRTFAVLVVRWQFLGDEWLRPELHKQLRELLCDCHSLVVIGANGT